MRDLFAIAEFLFPRHTVDYDLQKQNCEEIEDINDTQCAAQLPALLFPIDNRTL